ncbi:SDR family NAD(P)-dependent oxidoreductase [Gordonia sp. HNM0687]|uniref:SDR family NAD(P)-dependent oxidoreductase n=1 Tax=Gordonia mangrovi TaxID=2665643 RepID=A0A6L7GLL2_9ACTN|nr:SDR family NAD(P)-dependent oxidoreductase [Gordonia mangrovi]MXP20760.1 SDR family NAD(P)-dependent oxidoreductase [Gordonia mangrovi]UVF78670.1 SDR family NAD(P)-dependent oxidoreductase [Gordonia mangrovi]
MDTIGPILITGCSSGIGAATAAELVGAGNLVYATARNPDSLAELAAADCHVLALDVTDEESMRAAVDEIEHAHGTVGALVNNAGYSQSGAVESISLDDIRRQFETNVFGLVRMSQLVLPGMRRAGQGRIVNIGSMGGKLTFPGGGAYHATKYAVEALSDALRFEVAGFGIQVVLIEPGLIVTDFATAASSSMSGLDDDGPYGEFNAGLDATMKEIYSGPVAKVLGAGPDAVARTVRKALTADRPKARYTVTASAKLGIAQRRITPDRLWDRAMRIPFSVPRAERDR